ncbi:oligosaccharide flippase family protein [Candidatus Micrarchaeota archaeon]|nr:oligosaccharide flippase family protein [Candidatus Micrarchaeota archaeon]
MKPVDERHITKSIGNKTEAAQAAKRISIGSISGILSTGLTKVLTLLFYFLIFWFLTKEDAGLFLLSLSFIGIIGAFLSLGLPATINRFTAYYYGRKEYGKLKDLLIKGGALTFIFSGAIALSILYFRGQLVALYGQEELNSLIILIAIGSFLTILSAVVTSFINGKQRFVMSSALRFISPGLRLLLLTFFILHGFKTAYYALLAHIISIFAMFIIGLLVVLYDYVKMIGKMAHDKKKISMKEYIDLFSYGIPIYITASAGSISTQIDTLCIGYFMQPEFVAMYNSVGMIARNIGSFITSMFTGMLNSVLAYYYGKKNMKLFKKIAEYGTKWYIFFALPILLLILTFPKQILMYAFPQYVDSYWLFYILGPTFFVTILSSPFRSVLWAAGKTKIFMYVTLGIIIPNFILNVILIPVYGLLGGAIATMFAFISSESLFIYYSHKYYGVWFSRGVYKIFISGLLMLLFLLFVQYFTNVESISEWVLRIFPLTLPTIHISSVIIQPVKYVTILLLGILVLFGGMVYVFSWLLQRPFTKIEITTIKKALNRFGVVSDMLPIDMFVE